MENNGVWRVGVISLRAHRRGSIFSDDYHSLIDVSNWPSLSDDRVYVMGHSRCFINICCIIV